MFSFKNLDTQKITRSFALGIVTCLIVAGTFAIPEKAEAQAPPYVPFGGMNLTAIWCTCSFNLWVTVGPPRGGSYMYQPGATILYLFGQIWRPGAWLLGLAAPVPVPCLQIIPSPPWCVPIGGGLPMLIVGTSM